VSVRREYRSDSVVVGEVIRFAGYDWTITKIETNRLGHTEVWGVSNDLPPGSETKERPLFQTTYPVDVKDKETKKVVRTEARTWTREAPPGETH
jgi:hypothetical protein